VRRATVLLFDVDGTLISTGGVARRALERAFEVRHGRTGALAFDLGGMTDLAIVRDGLAALGSGLGGAALDAEIEATLVTYLGILESEIAGATVRVHDGIMRALDAADAEPRVACGLGTGNVREGARIKLGAAGIYHRFAFGGFGSDHVERAALLRAGAERGAARLGQGPGACRVVVIGDTPRDIAAARAIGAECVAVATGGTPLDELRAHAPDFAFPDLAADGALAALIG